MADFYWGKIALVTGGASGIGRALGAELCRRGAHAILADVDIERAEFCTGEIKKTGGSAEAMSLDVTDAKQVRTAVEETVTRHGRIDYLFNNAGIAILGDARDITLEQWKRVVDVDLWGVVHGVDAAYPVMVKQGFGHIVNTASMAGLIPIPAILSYTASKHAVVGLSLALRVEARDLGVKISVVCPGFVRTEIFDNAETTNINRDKLHEKVPIAANVDRAAWRILRGVKRNRAVITPTLDGRPFWRLYRAAPWLFGPILRNMVGDMRELRNE
ncbi:MAG: SDR family oxidoreductase [Deltaproteobacteria bacterium]|nr:SDR family oxidoreductase [Candidatus Zymogenaceae bacterium]